jgi:TRAP-type transport system periplasmic protein
MVVRPLLCALSLLVMGAAIGSPPVQAQEKFVLKVAIFSPEPSSASRWFKEKKAELSKESKGRLDLELFFGSAMGPMPRHYDLARTGVADLAWFQQGATPGRFPLTELLQSPFLYPAGAKGSIIASKVAGDLLPELKKEHSDVDLLWVVNNRPSGIYDGSKPLHTLADLKGRRYRAPTQADVAVLKAISAIPIGLPATEMAEGLQKGTIDGVVTDPMGVFSFKLGGLVKYYDDTVRTSITFGLALNKQSRAKLPEDLRKLVDELGGKAEGVHMAELTWQDFPVFDKYMKDNPVERTRLDAAADKALRAAADAYIEDRVKELEKKGLPARAFYTKAKELAAKYAGES